MDTFSLNLMNTNFYIAIPEGTSILWKPQVEEWLRYVAEEWSRFKHHNELSKINHLKKGESMHVSPLLYDCIKQANYYYTISKSYFSPYLKIQMEHHGYYQSFPFQNTDAISLKQKISKSSPVLLLNNNRVLKMDEQQIDLGGFAKGYIVENIASWLQKQGIEYGIVDGGGDMKLWSNGEKEWTIGIADPYDANRELNYIKIKNGAIATSNRVYRSWHQDGQEKHHLLNGQTGEVANSEILQATVVTNSLMEAEVIAKLCFLMEEAELTQWLEKNKLQCARFIIEKYGNGHWIKS